MVPSVAGQVVRRIEQECPLALVVLFGSHAKGTAHAHSDVDLAFMPRDPLALIPDGLRFAWEGVDVVWLPEASWLLWREAARAGEPLLEGVEGAFTEFRTQAEQESVWPRRDERFLERFRTGDWTVNRELIRRKLTHLARYLHELDEVLAVSLEEFMSSPIIHHAGERIVELIVETTGSLNSEIAQASGIPPSDYYSAFFSLARTGWVDSQLCTALAESARLRNAIVHRYEDLSLDRIHAAIHQLAPLWRRYFESLDARLR